MQRVIGWFRYNRRLSISGDAGNALAGFQVRDAVLDGGYIEFEFGNLSQYRFSRKRLFPCRFVEKLELFIAQKTARNHVERTYAKIGVSNRIGASMYALKHGLVNPAAG